MMAMVLTLWCRTGCRSLSLGLTRAAQPFAEAKPQMVDLSGDGSQEAIPAENRPAAVDGRRDQIMRLIGRRAYALHDGSGCVFAARATAPMPVAG